MKRLLSVPLLLLLTVLRPAFTQQSDLETTIDPYIFVTINVSEILFDFGAEEAGNNPGKLRLLDTYENYYPGGFPVATAESWKQCILGGADAPSGGYRGSPTQPSTSEGPVCRFAPTDITEKIYTVTYNYMARSNCTPGKGQSDADLVIVTNKDTWRAEANTSDRFNGVYLHILPLTLQDEPNKPTKLCKYYKIRKPTLHDVNISKEQEVLSIEPNPDDNSNKQRHSFFTQYSAIYTVPLLYYIEIDLSNIDLDSLGDTSEFEKTITVTYIVSDRQ